MSRLKAPLADVHRVDVISYLNDTETDVFCDVPFDARRGEVVVAPRSLLDRLDQLQKKPEPALVVTSASASIQS